MDAVLPRPSDPKLHVLSLKQIAVYSHWLPLRSACLEWIQYSLFISQLDARDLVLNDQEGKILLGHLSDFLL